MAVVPPSASGVAKVYRTELSPVSFLRRSAYVYPEKVAVVHGERRLTYHEFDKRVNQLASHLRPDSVQLWVVPMFHCNGWCFTWAVTAMGARHVCLRRVDPALMWELFDREGVTHYNGAPTVHLAVV